MSDIRKCLLFCSCCASKDHGTGLGRDSDSFSPWRVRVSLVDHFTEPHNYM